MTSARGVLDQVQADPPPFDICAELPSGTTVLEASAGTGKTYTIAALTARVVAEGVADLSQLLLVTFSRMATNELRLRVRERLVAVESSLADVAHRIPTRQLSDLEAMLCAGHPESWRVAATAFPGRSPSSTPPPLPPLTSSVCRCSTASACSATASRVPPWWSTCPTSRA